MPTFQVFNDLYPFIFFLFLILAVLPGLQRQGIERRRIAILKSLQKKRQSRVITLLHRQESTSLLGLLTRRHITIEDSEAVLRAIRMTGPDEPIDLILHTPGGLVLASEQIARALLKHKAKVTVMVPHYAMSGGAMLALAADEILMDENAVLGPVDPQIGGMPAASIVRAVEEKPIGDLEDRTLILADVARKAIQQVQSVVCEILAAKMEKDRAEGLARLLTQGTWTHDFPLTCEVLQAMGLPVVCGLPREVYRLMELYPQPPTRRPSVQYVPVSFDEP